LNRIYLDNAATTPIDEMVIEQMLPWLREQYGNASGIYETGREARKAVEEARRQVARALNCSASEIFFTGSGTESDNWAIKGVAWAHQSKGRHIISTAIEHHAVLHTLQALEKQGFSVTYVPVNELGRVNPEDIRAAIRDDTILVSVMAANNEIGTLQPIAQIGQITKERGVLFHTDAVQAVGAVPVDVQEWQVDLLSLSAHKFHGPKGVGALYVKKGVQLEPLLHGGAQERNRRAGTENLPGIVGLGKAIELACRDIEGKSQAVTALRDILIAGILADIPQVRLNGDPVHRLPNNVNISFRYVEGEALLLRLDLAGIAASSGSACTSGSLNPSHVLSAIGLPHEIAHGSLRLSLSKRTTRAEIDEVLRVLREVVRKLREMSPLYDEGEADVF
jgi:cysteine desulfurase